MLRVLIFWVFYSAFGCGAYRLKVDWNNSPAQLFEKDAKKAGSYFNCIVYFKVWIHFLVRIDFDTLNYGLCF